MNIKTLYDCFVNSYAKRRRIRPVRVPDCGIHVNQNFAFGERQPGIFVINDSVVFDSIPCFGSVSQCYGVYFKRDAYLRYHIADSVCCTVDFVVGDKSSVIQSAVFRIEYYEIRTCVNRIIRQLLFGQRHENVVYELTVLYIADRNGKLFAVSRSAVAVEFVTASKRLRENVLLAVVLLTAVFGCKQVNRNFFLVYSETA